MFIDFLSRFVNDVCYFNSIGIFTYFLYFFQSDIFQSDMDRVICSKHVFIWFSSDLSCLWSPDYVIIVALLLSLILQFVIVECRHICISATTLNLLNTLVAKGLNSSCEVCEVCENVK